MKNNITTILFIVLVLLQTAHAQTVEDANVSLSNLNSNSYFGSYDDNTKMVSDLNFMVLADGSNSSYVTPAFTVKVYIYDGSDPTFVKTYNDAGIYHFGSKTYSNESVDLSSLSLPAGTYRLGVYVDADDEIPSPPDDPADNAFLLDGDIVFTPGTSTAVQEHEKLSWELYPNPATDEVHMSWKSSSGTDAWQLTLRTMEGQLLRSAKLDPGKSSYTVDMRDMVTGVYILTLRTSEGVAVKRIVKQ